MFTLVRLLSSPTCPVLEALGKKISFEIAVGLNGRVWVIALPLPLSLSVSQASPPHPKKKQIRFLTVLVPDWYETNKDAAFPGTHSGGTIRLKISLFIIKKF